MREIEMLQHFQVLKNKLIYLYSTIVCLSETLDYLLNSIGCVARDIFQAEGNFHHQGAIST